MRQMLVAILVSGCLVASVQAKTPGDYRYTAVLEGDCEKLVLDGEDQTQRCASRLVNVDHGDGRVTFLVVAEFPDSVMTAFSGGSSHQSSDRSYVLDVDQVVTISETGTASETKPVEKPAIGRCTMDGDPLHERAVFECTAETADGRSHVAFRTRGTPSVSYGNAATKYTAL
jgi:hypothetical protein